MNELEKKLTEFGEDRAAEQNRIVDSAKMLLASNAAEERRTLRSIGLDYEINQLEHEKGDAAERQKAKALYGGSVLRREEIQDFCEKYRLYRRPAREYVGSIPATLGAELTRFCNEKKIPLPGSSDYSNFFIIAPPKMFKDYRGPLQVLAEACEVTIKETERRLKVIRDTMIDPILVYRTGDYFVVVKSWGDDFTPLRRLHGLLTAPGNMRWVMTGVWAIVSYLLYALASWQTSYFWSHYPAGPSGSLRGPRVLAGIIDFVIIIVAIIWTFSPLGTDFRKAIRRQVNSSGRQGGDTM